MSEKHIDMTERLQKIGQTVNEYKDALTSHFKDMDVEVKDWHFTVGKLEKSQRKHKLLRCERDCHLLQNI